MNFIQEDYCIYLLDEQEHRIAEITFPKVDNYYLLNHTFVDDCLKGQGIASELVEMVMKQARISHTSVYITCSYARTWIQKHEEYQNLWIPSI